MFDPEFADSSIRMAQGQVVVGLGMGKESRVEIKPQPLIPGPIHPRGKVPEFNFVPVRCFIRVKVTGMQVEAVFSGDSGIGEFQIRAQFIGCAGATGVIAGGLNAAT